jgi:hypothetical protein
MKHEVWVTQEPKRPGALLAFRPRCKCGWTSTYSTKLMKAQRLGEAHMEAVQLRKEGRI